MSITTPFHNPSIEAHFERKHQLREHACPVGCHQHSNYPPDQYHEYECEHQKAHRDRKRLMQKLMWTQNHIQEIKKDGGDARYWENEWKSCFAQLERGVELWKEELSAAEARAKAMPHIYS